MESIETLNQRLVDEFGKDSDTGHPMFRIVWSNDETEMRLMDVTDLGVELIHPEVRLVKKYPYMKDIYVLERLVAIPEANLIELPATKISYEPIWAYRDDENNPLPPIWPATKFVIDCLFAALGKKSMANYVDSEKNTTPEGREQRISELQEELFGDETETGDAMRYGEAIVVPSNYKKEN
jgi:hypothetical protein